jgi:hypothetical protein
VSLLRIALFDRGGTDYGSGTQDSLLGVVGLLVAVGEGVFFFIRGTSWCMDCDPELRALAPSSDGVGALWLLMQQHGLWSHHWVDRKRDASKKVEQFVFDENSYKRRFFFILD